MDGWYIDRTWFTVVYGMQSMVHGSNGIMWEIQGIESMLAYRLTVSTQWGRRSVSIAVIVNSRLRQRKVWYRSSSGNLSVSKGPTNNNSRQYKPT